MGRAGEAVDGRDRSGAGDGHAIELVGVAKAFGSHVVLRDVDLRIAGGEFVALLGANGAGKSTLIKILAGMHAPSGGTIRFGASEVASLAGHPHVGFLHQDLGLVPALNVVENLRLGEQPMLRAGVFLDGRRERQAAREALSLVGLAESLDTLVADLSAGEQALVAIARLLSRGARVLVVDEATSSLPPSDAQRLMAALRRTVRDGATVIMVSHRLDEVLDGPDRVVVLEDGRVAADVPTAGLDRAGLTRLLAPVDTAERAVAPRPVRPVATTELVRLEDAWVGGIGPIDLAVHAGEVVGLTGLAGSGLHDIAFAVHGSADLRHGRLVRAPGTASAIVPPYREQQGGFPDLDVKTNLTLSALPTWRDRFGLLRGRAERRDAAALVQRLSIVPPSIDAPFGTLSGGNKQKVIFGRAIARNPQLYVLCEPTRGVDVATRREIYGIVEQLSQQGAGVLVASSDVDDLVAVCDRVATVGSEGLGEFVATSDLDVVELEGGR